ncbi:diguanylate cyclase [Ideonella sp. A 288]|uniref:GGDEF domain-containing protein n=1 Tax=Ideonella sp. A 288 TaxID=1962181 RepID=UPI001303AFC3|nr:GGDEF domain-containing protein [Ideonella sp. A 288]
MVDFSSLMGMVAVQLLIYAAGLGLCSLLLRQQRAAMAHWAAFLLLQGVGFVLLTHRSDARTWWAFVGSGLCFTGGFVTLRRGLLVFVGLPTRDREQAIGWGLTAALMVALGPQVDQASWRVILSYGFAVWAIGRAAADCVGPLKREFGRLPFWMLSVPASLLVLMSSERVIRQALNMNHPIELHSLTDGSGAVIYGYLIGASMFCFTFTGLLVTRLVKSLHHTSQTDPLTGLLNRRAMEAQLLNELRRSRRSGSAFAVVSLDLDHFKRVNDLHGHPAGDLVLIETGQRLLRAARSTDTVARTGGEEFIVLMPEVTAGGAREAAERLRQSIGETRFEIDVEGRTHAVRMTVSVGVAMALPGEDDPRPLMQRVDKALYRAKSEGRDRVAEWVTTEAESAANQPMESTTRPAPPP